MRLICPNCGAQYEVPDEVIPQEGRDVQCSSCSNTWFQTHPDQDRALADEIDAPSVEPIGSPPAQETDPAPEPSAPQPPSTPAKQRSLDPNIADVLREEAKLEAAARAAEQRAPLESQPDLGLQDPPEDEVARRAREARERMAKMRGEPLPVPGASGAGQAASRSDLLPDIEEINSTLRASGERRRPAEAKDSDLKGTTPKLRRKGRGFRAGFYGTLLIGAIAVAAYVYSPRLTQWVPAATPVLSEYTAQVETARSWLNTNVGRGLAWLDQLASENL